VCPIADILLLAACRAAREGSLLRVTPRLRERQVQANGIRFGIIEAGQGPLALCLHGFPDSAWTWRHLLPALASAGRHAVAPFTRGYAPTDIAPDGRYDLDALVADAVALHEVLGGDDRAALIGHDWGAETAYGASASAPERWRRLVTIGVPPLALDARIFSDYDQLKRLFYLFFLKTAGAASVVAADDMAFVDRLWADWSPGYDGAADARRAKACLRDPRHLDAAVAYYRADEPGLHPAGHAALLSTPPQPTLYLHGDRDGSLDVNLVRDAAEHLAPGSRMEVVEGAGHFLHLERPAAVNERIVAWVAGERT
jgi:pimeloyl-ACP methyl ester carboxylesterase